MQSHSSNSIPYPSAVPSSSSAAGKPDRLYVGNLSPTVDEYALLQIFGKYGKITKLDFMFHKSGVLKGKPRGFAFIEFSNKDDALKSMVKLHDRLLRGRKLVVTYANSAPPSDLPLPTKGRRSTEAAKPTTLSLLKSQRRPKSAAAQIAAMEAKLALMEKRKPADEDYVPGQGQYRDGFSPSASGSPMPADVELEGEGEIGLQAAELAADDLELELQAELAGHKPDVKMEDDSETIKDEAPVSPIANEVPKPGYTTPTTLPTITVTPASLPPRPVTSDNPPIRPIPTLDDKAQAREEKTKARTEEYQRGYLAGLAGLPKKPMF